MTIRDAFRASAATAVFVFVGTFALGMVGWLQDVADWANDHGATPFPGFGALAYVAVSAAVAAASFVVNAVVRLAQAKGLLPGAGPTYTTTHR